MDIPLDICEKIFLSLEIKDLLSCNCVCTSWRDLISGAEFAKRRLEQSIKDPEQNHHQIFQTFPLATLDYNALCGKKDSLINRKSKDLRPPPQFSSRYLKIMGSCDGLICLMNEYSISYKETEAIFIWNPSSKELLTLSKPGSSHGAEFYWFGRDNSSNGTYKLVVGLDDYARCYGGRAMYALNYNGGLYNWRKTEGKSLYISEPFEKRGTYLHGPVHWPYYQFGHHVFSYELSQPKVRSIPAPNVVQLDSSSPFTLAVFDECLCAVFKFAQNFEIWMMKEYGVPESWTRWMKLDGFEGNSRYLRPLGFLKNGDLIVDVDRKKFVRYSFEEKTAKVVETYYDVYSDATTYVESLISPKAQVFN